jgi:hypothetical protein
VDPVGPAADPRTERVGSLGQPTRNDCDRDRSVGPRVDPSRECVCTRGRDHRTAGQDDRTRGQDDRTRGQHARTSGQGVRTMGPVDCSTGPRVCNVGPVLDPARRAVLCVTRRVGSGETSLGIDRHCAASAGHPVEMRPIGNPKPPAKRAQLWRIAPVITTAYRLHVDSARANVDSY